VPIITGYRALSEIYPAGTISNTRDSDVPFCFVEGAYGLGEWQSPHRLQNIDEALWHYHDKEGWYLCSSQITIDAYTVENEEDDFDFL
jgi:CRISPR-associated protein Csy2